MRDLVVMVALAVAFGALVTTHVAIVVRLLFHPPRYRSLVALLLPPLAPMWAYGEKWKRMSYLWLGALVGYGVALVVASF